MAKLICPFRSCEHFNGECVLAEVKLRHIRDFDSVSNILMECTHYKERPSEDILDAAYQNGQQLVKQIAYEYKLSMPDAANMVIKNLTQKLGCTEVQEHEPEET